MGREQFTPGPWAVAGRAWSVTAADGQMNVCDIRGWGYLTGRGSLALSDAEGVAIQTANANLIAAAPDLYAALEACRDQFDFYASEHRKAEKHDKAATNERFAFLATQALGLARGETL